MLTVRAASASPFTAVRDGERDAIYAELLSTGPAHRVAGRSGPIGWLITGHEEARSLLARYPRLRLDTGPGAVTRYPSMVMNGLTALPVHLR